MGIYSCIVTPAAVTVHCLGRAWLAGVIAWVGNPGEFKEAATSLDHAPFMIQKLEPEVYAGERRYVGALLR